MRYSAHREKFANHDLPSACTTVFRAALSWMDAGRVHRSIKVKRAKLVRANPPIEVKEPPTKSLSGWKAMQLIAELGDGSNVTSAAPSSY